MKIGLVLLVFVTTSAPKAALGTEMPESRVVRLVNGKYALLEQPVPYDRNTTAARAVSVRPFNRVTSSPSAASDEVILDGRVYQLMEGKYIPKDQRSPNTAPSPPYQYRIAPSGARQAPEWKVQNLDGRLWQGRIADWDCSVLTAEGEKTLRLQDVRWILIPEIHLRDGRSWQGLLRGHLTVVSGRSLVTVNLAEVRAVYPDSPPALDHEKTSEEILQRIYGLPPSTGEALTQEKKYRWWLACADRQGHLDFRTDILCRLVLTTALQVPRPRPEDLHPRWGKEFVELADRYPGWQYFGRLNVQLPCVFGVVYYNQGHWEAAAENFSAFLENMQGRRGVEEHTDLVVRAYEALISSLIQLADYDEASAVCEQYVRFLAAKGQIKQVNRILNNWQNTEMMLARWPMVLRVAQRRDDFYRLYAVERPAASAASGEAIWEVDGKEATAEQLEAMLNDPELLRTRVELLCLLAEGLVPRLGVPIGTQAFLAKARLEQADGRMVEALKNYEKACAYVQSRRNKLPLLSTHREKFLEQYMATFWERTRLLFADDQIEAALDSWEEAKARSLVEQIQDKERRVKPAEGTLAARRVALEIELRRLANEMGFGIKESDAKRSEARVEEIVRQIRSVDEEIARQDPLYAAWRDPNPVKWAEFKTLLGPQEAVLVYAVGREEVLYWIATTQRLAGGTIAYSHEKLERDVSEYLSLLSSQKQDNRRVRVAELGYQIYRQIVQPAISEIRSENINRILVVPDGPLYFLPLATLVEKETNGEKMTWDAFPFLVRRYEFCYGPSLSVCHYLRQSNRGRQNPGGNQTLILSGPFDTTATVRFAAANDQTSRGNPWRDWTLGWRPLPGAVEEARELTRLFAGNVTWWQGAKASENAVKSANLLPYRYLHFATHAFANPEAPLFSGLLLTSGEPFRGDDGLLETYEVLDLHLNADLVTLSACETALGQISKAEGVYGLLRAFLVSGSRNVLSSLWNIKDRPTKDLMVAFYSRLNRGDAIPTALRAAQLSLLEGGPGAGDERAIKVVSPAGKSSTSAQPLRPVSPTISDPNVWGAFILVGSGLN